MHFWQMTPSEAALYIEVHTPPPDLGGLTVEQYEMLEAKREELIEQGHNVA